MTLRPASDISPQQPSPASRSVLTVPNVLCTVRFLASPILIVLAWADRPNWCVGLAAFLFLTDWVDGKLAIVLDQRTVFGARLDSVADVTFYSCLLLAMLILRGDLFRQEGVWIGAAVVSYLVSSTAGLLKHHRLPSYHTRLAKTSWLLTLIAVIAIFTDWSPWAIRIAALGVMVTNLETILITALLPEWRANVPSVFHAFRTATGREDDVPC